jgi:initiation factor 1A
MVKNTTGGKRAKLAGRKHETAAPARLRTSEDPAELYAVVTKMWGNGLVQVNCNDGVSRQCVIRQKFRGRRARDNHVTLGSAVLVGLREFETAKDKCDLLEVYTSTDVDRLRLMDSSWTVLLGEKDRGDEELDAVEVVDDTPIHFDDI